MNVKTCKGNDECNLISITCVVIDCTVIIDNAMDYSGAQLNTKINNHIHSPPI
jgi:low affinity Fe/Cu permease